MKKTLTKRKMYQKRRKKEKQEKRRIQKQQTATKGATMSGLTANITGNNNNSKHLKQKPHNTINNMSTTNSAKFNSQHIPYHQYPNPSNCYTEGMRQWWQTYCTAIQYHSEQGKQWQAMNSGKQTNAEELLQRYAEEYDTSSGEEEYEEEQYRDATKYNECKQQTIINEKLEEDEEQEAIDAEYLKFLEITYKHREELKLKRAAENSVEHT